ncbi:MAG: hypothetical protein Kow0080_07660 [Candidatus Promineifilaceae bacterium]
MDIRSITLFCTPEQKPAETAAFLAAARQAFPFPVQTIRLATTPFPEWLANSPKNASLNKALDFASGWREAGIHYISLGPVLLSHHPDWLDTLPALIGAGDMLFATAEIADQNGRIDTARIQKTTHIIRQASQKEANGFGNLYFAALAHCAPGSPFFPVAYHQGQAPAFALAVESADLALQAIQSAHTLDEARTNLVTAVEQSAAQLTVPARQLAQQHGITFGGIDFSLAPFPTDDKSLGGALEAFGLPHIGASGSLFAAALVTEAIEQAQFPRCGFSGLMLPVLEDSVLAKRAAAGELTVADLLSYSAVCGVGLDTIPLPGDVDEAQLTAVLLDVAALAARLRKPLTARLMPLPGLAAGDPVTFDFPYFADSRVMAVRGTGASHLLAKPAVVTLNPIRKRFQTSNL